MNITGYRLIQALCILILLIAEACLSFVVLWLSYGGVIACGKGIFDSPRWPLDIIPFLGVPLLFMFGAVALFLWCSSRLVRRGEPRAD